MKIILLLIVLIAAFAFTLSAGSTITTEDAGKKLRAGAVLVDVRTTKEFAAKHLAGATNIPLDTIKTGITNVAPTKSTLVLLHCQTGGRSGRAEKELRSLGYTNCFNVGSFERADAAVKATRK